jgi:general secretion pathway protein N
MMVRATIVLLAGMLAVAGAAALAATPPVVVEPREDALGLGRAAAVPGATAPAARAAQTAPSTSAGAERVPSGNPLWAIPLRQLSATRERPLFAPSRRPPPPVVAYQLASVPTPPPPKPAEPEKPRLSLVGTVAGGTEGIGVFIDPATRSVLRLKMGERHEGWVLRAVRRREATLEKGRQTAVLTLPPPEMSKSGPVPPPLAPPNRAADGTEKASTAAPSTANASGGGPSAPPTGGASGSPPAGAPPPRRMPASSAPAVQAARSDRQPVAGAAADRAVTGPEGLGAAPAR